MQKFLLGIFLYCVVCYTNAQPVQLANSFHNQNIRDYLISEKLDGVRAIWTGKKLTTRNGNLIVTPIGFTKGWPNVWLDGELWSHRQAFEFVASTVLDKKPKIHDWQRISFNVFDMPDPNMPFVLRYQNYKTLLESLDLPNLKPIAQYTFKNEETFYTFYQQLTSKGAEGVMLHKKSAKFQSGRTSNLLKLKPFQDAEAIVIGRTEGKGKYSGLVGALIVKTKDGITFRIGSGLSDEQRRNPPEIGQRVTYRFSGLTKYGKPRFPRLLRIRPLE